MRDYYQKTRPASENWFFSRCDLWWWLNKFFQFAPLRPINDRSILCQEVSDEFLHILVIMNPMDLRVVENGRRQASR